MKLANNQGNMAFLLNDNETQAVGQLLKNSEITTEEFADIVKQTNIAEQINKNKMLLAKVMQFKKEELKNNE